MAKENKEQLNLAQQVKKFVMQCVDFYIKCKKPDYTEYMKILQACIMGFFIMGAIGYFIKLVFIPINNIILSWVCVSDADTTTNRGIKCFT